MKGIIRKLQTVWYGWRKSPKAVVMIVLGTVFDMLSLYINAVMIILLSDLFASGDINILYRIIAWLCTDIVSYSLGSYMRDYAFRYVYTVAMDDYIRKVLYADYALFTKYSVSYINTAAQFINGMATAGNLVQRIIVNAAQLVITVSAIAYVGSGIVIPVLIIYGAGAVLFRFIFTKYESIEERRSKAMEERNQELENIINGFTEIRSFHTQKAHEKNVTGLNHTVFDEGRKKSVLNMKLNAAIMTVANTGVIACALYILAQMAGGEITQSGAMSLIMFVTTLENPIVGILDFAYAISDNTALEKNYRSVMEFQNKLANDGNIKLDSFEKEIEVKNASFSYDNTKDILKNISLKIPKGSKVAVVGVSGGGKMQPVDTPIPTPNGWRKMGDLSKGDHVFSIDGSVTAVTGVFPHKHQQMYKVTFSDGRSTLCGGDHLWRVIKRSHGKMTDSVMSALEIWQECFMGKKNKPYRYSVPVLSTPVKYPHSDVPVDPWIVGVFTGNGCMTETYLKLSSGDPAIPEKAAEILGFTAIKYSDKNYSYSFKDKNGRLVRTKDVFGSILEIMGCSKGRHLPECYIRNSADVRFGVLQGLMDTNGSICPGAPRFNTYSAAYTSTSEALLMQMQEIIRSLGYNANITVDKRKGKYSDGYCGTLMFHVPHIFKPKLFRYSEHKMKHALDAAALANDPHKKNYDRIRIRSIEPAGFSDAVCISVDHPSEMYLTEGFIPTHNTTLFKLLMKLNEVQDGEILIDGININNISNDSYFSHVGAVHQENEIFPCSIRKNVMYGNPKATEEEFIAACKKSKVYDFAMQLENRFETEVGPHGVKLSGGQKQRIALARIILRNPDIILLDEATSALDNESEMEIQEAIDALSGKTIITIAHRLSTVRNSDYIYVLDTDGVVEEGTPADLEKARGVYWKMINANKQKEDL